MRYTINLTVALAILWLLLSGMWTYPIILSLGVASVALTVWMAHRLDLARDNASLPRLLTASLKYWPWLFWQIILSNIQVAILIVRGRAALSPSLAKVRSSQTQDIGRTIFANSITLTPGTVAIRVSDGEIFYYALTTDLIAELDEGEMDRRVSRLEREL